MNKFEQYIKNIYPNSIIKHIKNKTVVLTEDGINFSFVFKCGYFNIDFIYVFDEVKCQGIFSNFVIKMSESKFNVKIINVVSSIVNHSLKERYINIVSEMECIEIPAISFRKNPILKINYSEEELEAIDEKMEEWLIDDDGLYGDYIISVA